MGETVRYIKIKKENGTITDKVPIGAEAKNVIMNNGDSVEKTIEKMQNYIYKDKLATVHYPFRHSNAGNTSIIESLNENILIDMGTTDSFNELKNYLIENNIIKFKYFIISHFDEDHFNYDNFINLLSSSQFNFSDCIFITHSDLNWNRTTGLSTQQQAYNDFKNYIISHNYKIKNPNEEEIIFLDNFNYLKFYNVNSSFYDQYYSIMTDDADVIRTYTNYNNFSLVTEFNTSGKTYLFVGDIGHQAETNIYREIEKIDVYCASHHGLNRISEPKFLEKIQGKNVIVMNTNNLPTNTPIYQYTIDNCGKLFDTNSCGNIKSYVFQNEIIIESDYNRVIGNAENQILKNTDLNNIKKDGVYVFNENSFINTLSNLPFNYNNFFKLYVSSVNRNSIIQTLQTVNYEPIFYFRKTIDYGDNWSQWRKMKFTRDNLVKYGLTSSQTIESTSFELVNFNSKKYERGSDISNSNGVFTISNSINDVFVNAEVSFSGSLQANDRIAIEICVDDTAVKRADKIVNDVWDSMQLSAVLYGIAGKTISVKIRNITAARGSVNTDETLTNITINEI